MFFPADSLRRGGRFHLCWIADSWPLRFQALPQNQLWLHDIRKICDDLIEVVKNESGRPARRFSLRLSSQLMRGLVRLYQRKTNLLMGNLCMINARIIRNVNKKYAIDIDEKIEKALPQQLEIHIPQEEIQDEQRIEVLLDNTRNIVNNIQDITLKESAIPEYQPPADGFGEENLNEAMRMLTDRTMEMMLEQVDVTESRSHLNVALETTDKSQERSRLAPDAHMERISERDITLFGRTLGAESQLPVLDTDIPAIPEISHPEVPEPVLEMQEKRPEEIQVDPSAPKKAKKVQPTQEPQEIELEELEEFQPLRRRRRLRKLIIDKKTKLGSNIMRARVNNNALELRCQSTLEDIVKILLPWNEYMRRPAHFGGSVRSHVGFHLTELYQRSLNVKLDQTPRPIRQLQEALAYKTPVELQAPLTAIPEIVEPVPELVGHVPEIMETVAEAQVQGPLQELNTNIENMLNITEPRASAVPIETDISDLPTQKLEVLPPQETLKRGSEEPSPPAKRSACGIAVYRRFLPRTCDAESNKENVPQRISERYVRSQPLKRLGNGAVSQMLRNSGLADIPVDVRTSKDRNPTSPDTETPLGSLDRTRVSLGDSDETTESLKIVHDEWGTEGTMLKIVKFIQCDYYPITVHTLTAAGPVVPGRHRIVAARCFNSLLRLKQHGFIRIEKNPDTSEVIHITFGPKFEQYDSSV